MKFSRDIWILLIASGFYMSAIMMINPIIAGYAGELGAGAALMGFIGGLQFLAALLVRPFTGQLSDTITKQKLSTIGLLIIAVATAGYYISVNPVMIIASRTLAGIGFSCVTVCLSTWLSGLFPKERLGYGMGIYGMVNALCLAVGPIIGIQLYERAGYGACFAVSFIFLAGCLLMIRCMENKGESLVKKSEKKLQVIDMKVVPIALMVALMAMPYFATQTFIVKYVEQLELDISVSLFFPAYAISLVILRVIFRNYFDAYPFRNFLFICTACEAGFIVLMALAKGSVVMILAAILLAGGYGIMCSVSQATAMLMADYERRGLANSTYMFGLDLGTTIGAVLGGILFGNVPLKLFFPCLGAVLPLILVIYAVTRRNFAEVNRKNMKRT